MTGRERILAQLVVEPGTDAALAQRDPGWTGGPDYAGLSQDELEAEAKAVLARDVELLSDAQELLWASDTRALLVVFQAMDAAGKDSAIEHVMSGVNPQGVQVVSFKKPSSEELDHAFLWRIAKAAPERGRIGVFNRSHYEEVVALRVHPEWLDRQRLPDGPRGQEFWNERYEDINAFERHLHRNGTTIVKFFLNVSKRVHGDDVRQHAERLATAPVSLASLALAFEESAASSAEVHVEGRNFYPPMLADIASASSSVHINQFGFRPGVVGDAFADALVAKVQEGVAVRMVVDRQGSDPERGARALYDRLAAAGVQICVVRATKPRASTGPLGAAGSTGWNLAALGHIDHRKLVVVDGRVGWVGGAGIEDHFHDGRFHDLFVRLTGPVVAQFQLVFLASFRWLGGGVRVVDLESLFPPLDAGGDPVPAVVLHNAPGRYRPITDAIARLIEDARETLDVVNPYVTDRRMIRRVEQAARRGVQVRLFVPANANNWACAAAQQFHHAKLLDAGVRILEYPAMLHAKAFVRDREELVAGTCNLEAWSLKRFFEIDVRIRSTAVAAQFDERFSTPAEAASSPGRRLTGTKERLRATTFAALSPLL